MGPDKSESFDYKSVDYKSVAGQPDTSRGKCRVRLDERFEKENKNDRSILSGITLDETRRALRTSAEKISKTLSSVRTSLGNFSQRFKSSTKRRQILEEGPTTPYSTPQARVLLGRTPTKLYSPFGIETPGGKENLPPNKKLEWPRKKNLLDDVD